MPLGSPLSASCSGQGEELAKQPLARTCCSLPSPAFPAGRDGLKRSHGKKKKGVCRALGLLAPWDLRVLCGQLITEVKQALGDQCRSFLAVM